MKLAKQQIHEQTREDMRRHLAVPAWSDRQKLALTCRMLAGEGHGSGLAGQVTARAAPGRWWTLPLGVGFDEATASRFILVDDALGVVEGEGMPNPAVRFHLWIYRARPAVNCIIHTHPPYASALSMVGKRLVVAHMDAAMFHDDCAYLAEWPGVPVADDEGRLIAGALGTKRSILLAHHGMLTTGATVEEAAYLAVLLERAARLQVRAEAIGEIRPIDPAHAQDAHDFLLKPEIVGATFAYFARQALAGAAGCLE
jgi:L-fuculose-phosphate aldolase